MIILKFMQVKVHQAHLADPAHQAHKDFQENEELLENPVLQVLEEPQVHKVRREMLEQWGSQVHQVLVDLPEYLVHVEFKVLLDVQDQKDPKDHLVYLVDQGMDE